MHDDNRVEVSENEESIEVKELDEGLEKDLCDLWDMTVEKNVCSLLAEYNGVQIFQGFMAKLNLVYPRASEILFGILVNMSTLSAENVVSQMSFLDLFDIFLKTKDAPCMIQILKLFNVKVRYPCKI